MGNQTKGNPNVAEASMDRIKEALELLNREAGERKTELTRLIDEKYSNFKDILGEAMGGGMEKIRGVVAAGEEKIKEVSTDMERRIYENPWMSVGISAGAGFLLGYFVGSRCAKEE